MSRYQIERVKCV